MIRTLKPESNPHDGRRVRVIALLSNNHLAPANFVRRAIPTMVVRRAIPTMGRRGRIGGDCSPFEFENRAVRYGTYVLDDVTPTAVRQPKPHAVAPRGRRRRLLALGGCFSGLPLLVTAIALFN